MCAHDSGARGSIGCRRLRERGWPGASRGQPLRRALYGNRQRGGFGERLKRRLTRQRERDAQAERGEREAAEHHAPQQRDDEVGPVRAVRRDRQYAAEQRKDGKETAPGGTERAGQRRDGQCERRARGEPAGQIGVRQRRARRERRAARQAGLPEACCRECDGRRGGRRRGQPCERARGGCPGGETRRERERPSMSAAGPRVREAECFGRRDRGERQQRRMRAERGAAFDGDEEENRAGDDRQPGEPARDRWPPPSARDRHEQQEQRDQRELQREHRGGVR
ncbi:hypothetical protein X997_5533 [Burkholderia pseudomallei A79C]|nr:hypothetical protein X997_5533 [Burkholderia pseudomallei A79C]